MTPISDATKFCVYQLMLGGIDETQPLRLANLTGLDVTTLTRDFLGRLFVEAQKRWGGAILGDLNRTEHGAEFHDVEFRPVAHAEKLPNGRSIECDHCERVCRVVPCQFCANLGRSPRWGTYHKSDVGRDFVDRPELDPGYVFDDYHGRVREDV